MKITEAKLRRIIREAIEFQSETDKIIDLMIDSAESGKQAIELAETLGIIENVDYSDFPNSTTFYWVADEEFANQFLKHAKKHRVQSLDSGPYYRDLPGKLESGISPYELVPGKLRVNYSIPNLKSWPGGWRKGWG